MDVKTFNPLVTSVARQASAQQVLRLPWQTRSIPLGLFFNSKTSSTVTDPFSRDSAFDAQSLRSSRVRHNPSDGDASYKSCESTSSSTSTDHLSVGVGLGVSCPVASAGVSCQFDRDVIENNDASKTSVMTTYRAGSVTFQQPPRLSEVALQTLKYDGGLSAFKERWGDYYVAGYRIGGDAGVMMSLASGSKNTTDSVTVCIKVEVLFFSSEESWSKDWSQAQTELQVTLSCFSTVEKLHVREERQLGDPTLYSFIQEARGIHDRAQRFVSTIQRKLDQIGISKDKDITTDQCVELCESGVVVELLLFPIRTLRELQYWITDDNIICL